MPELPLLLVQMEMEADSRFASDYVKFVLLPHVLHTVNSKIGIGKSEKLLHEHVLPVHKTL